MARRSLFALLVGLILCLALGRFLYSASTVPAYVAFDMDLLMTVDSFLIASGRLPDHFGHPGFGMNLLLSKSQWMAHVMGFLPNNGLTELNRALNPLLPAIEMTAYNRAHSPWVALAIVSLCWCMIALATRWPPWLALLGMGALASQQGLIYQSMGIRSELYSVFFWSLGMLALSLVARRRGRDRLLWALVGGLALGMAFLTKVQALFYLVAAGFFLYLMLDLSGAEEEGYDPKLGASMSAGALLLFLTLLRGAWNVEPTKGMGTFASSFGLTAPALGLAVFLLTLTVAQRRATNPYLASTSALMLGFVLSAGLHFLVFRDPYLSWRYLLIDMKMLYLRPDFYGSQSFQTPGAFFVRLWTVSNQNPVLVMVTLVSLLWSVQEFRKRTQTSGLLLALGASAVLTVAVGSRNNEHDWLWVETLPTTLTLLCAGFLARQERSTGRLALGLMVGLLIVSNLYLSSTMAARYRDSQATYGYRPWRFSHAVFAASYRLYSEPMRKHLLSAGWSGFSAAVRQMADFREVSLTALAIAGQSDCAALSNAAPGLPVWQDRPEWLVSSVSPRLSHSLLIDLGGQSRLRVGQRTDQAVFLLLDAEHFQKASGRPVPAAGEKLELARGEEAMTLYPLEVIRPTEFETAQVGPNVLIATKSLLDMPEAGLPPDPSW